MYWRVQPMATRQLILLRHAKSDWYSGVARDFDRPLNARGRRDAPRMGRWLHFNGLVPDVICCSSAVRTRETLGLVATELNVSHADIHYLGNLYHADEGEIASVVDDHLPTDGRMMVVGHNPGLEMALLQWCPDLRVPADGKVMPTAAVAVLGLSREASPSLVHLVRPKDL